MADTTSKNPPRQVKRSFTSFDLLGRISRSLDGILKRLNEPLQTSSVVGVGLRTAQYQIGQQAQRIAFANPNRNRLVVKNINSSAASVAISSDQGILSTNGYVLQQGDREELTNTYGDVFAIAGTGTVSITVLEE